MFLQPYVLFVTTRHVVFFFFSLLLPLRHFLLSSVLSLSICHLHIYDLVDFFYSYLWFLNSPYYIVLLKNIQGVSSLHICEWTFSVRIFSFLKIYIFAILKNFLIQSWLFHILHLTTHYIWNVIDKHFVLLHGYFYLIFFFLIYEEVSILFRNSVIPFTQRGSVR